MKVFFFNFLFTHLTLLGLHCTQTFSSCGEQGLLSSCSTWASHCSDFSCWGTQAMDVRASVVVAHGLSSGSCQALEYRLSSCGVLDDWT